MNLGAGKNPGPLWEGCRESRRYSRETYPESYITKYTSIRRNEPGLTKLVSPHRPRHGLKAFHPKNGSSQGQNLALTGLCVPSSLDSGPGHKHAFKAHRHVYHSTLGWRVIKKKKRGPESAAAPPRGDDPPLPHPCLTNPLSAPLSVCLDTLPEALRGGGRDAWAFAFQPARERERERERRLPALRPRRQRMV